MDSRSTLYGVRSNKNWIINEIKNSDMKTKQFFVTLIAVLSLSVGQAWGWTITLHYGLGSQTTTSHTGGVALPGPGKGL